MEYLLPNLVQQVHRDFSTDRGYFLASASNVARNNDEHEGVVVKFYGVEGSSSSSARYTEIQSNLAHFVRTLIAPYKLYYRWITHNGFDGVLLTWETVYRLEQLYNDGVLTLPLKPLPTKSLGAVVLVKDVRTPDDTVRTISYAAGWHAAWETMYSNYAQLLESANEPLQRLGRLTQGVTSDQIRKELPILHRMLVDLFLAANETLRSNAEPREK